MDTVFIINPKAGKAKDIEKLVSDIKNAVNDAEIYMTKASRDATRFVREYCEKHSAARIFAYGGDGTLSEVVNGAVGFDGVEIGIIPSGTGNDFCRNFPDSDFKDLSAQVGGEAIPCDVIRYRTTLNGEEKTGYCINMFNIGFDCNVADMTAKMKKNSFVNGSFAYIISIFTMLIKKNGAN